VSDQKLKVWRRFFDSFQAGEITSRGGSSNDGSSRQQEALVWLDEIIIDQV
jgi:hypothetical protein